MIVLAEKLRNIIFWVLDFLKGSKVSTQLNEISSTLYNYDASKNMLDKKLANILSVAANHTKYYSAYKQANIQNFPVINKNIIRQNENAFISSKYDKDKLIQVVTSGSTGTPFCVYHDVQKKIRNTADTIYFAKQANFNIGQKLYYFKIWNDINKKSWFNTWSQNIEACNVFSLSDAAIQTLIDAINADASTIGFLAYASAFDAICRYLDKNPHIKITANVQSAIAMSEALNEYTKQGMQKHFNCQCVSRYSNVENGMIAQQQVGAANEFYINFASYYVEVLNIDNDKPCTIGQAGRIVVTDLYNQAMPLIRYDTGDIGVLAHKNINGVDTPILQKIEGRKMDMVFNTAGHLVSSFTITNGMWKYTELSQYQFIQTGKATYLFKLNCTETFAREALLIDDFKIIFGQDANIQIEFVTEIPLLHSGKRKKVMNLYHTQ